MSPDPSIIFLSSTIRGGSGGVADYCQNLRRKLEVEGVECHLAAWEEGESRTPTTGEVFLKQPGHNCNQKGQELRAYVEKHNVEWFSLQFVSYGFGHRGIIGGLARALKPVARCRRVHVFLHELWLGHQSGAKLFERCWGAIQRRQILYLLRVLRPVEVWTNIGYYQRQLARHGVDSKVVPIFGNIPFSSANADEHIFDHLCSTRPCENERERWCFVGLFGSLYPNWPFRELIPRVIEWAKSRGRRPLFVLFGRNGETGEFRRYVSSFQDARFIQLGELGGGEIDRVMNSMDVALATTPAEATFKSSSAVAFLERGVPTVAVPGMLEGTSPPVLERHPCLVVFDQDLISNLDRARASRCPMPLLPRVADCYRDLFLRNDLGDAEAISQR